MKAQYSKTRLGIVLILFVLSFVVFFGRLLFVQVVKGGELRERARRQYLESIDIPAARGEIFDCRGQKVAANSNFQSLFAYPLSKGQIDTACSQLAYIFNCSYSHLAREYDLRPNLFVWIKRHLDASELARFRRLGKPCGLFLREEPTRIYPNGTVGRGVLGFVDLDNRGRSGLELMMNDLLTGHDGRALIQKDGRGGEYPIRAVPIREAVAGQSIVLTIDWRKQQIVEEELQRAVEKHNALGGLAVFIDPHTGAILAAADFDAESPRSKKPLKLRAVSDIFEPGSVFKLITAAAALEGGVQPADTFFAEDGLWRLGRHILRDDHEFSWLTFRESFENSSNIIMGKVANQIGGDRVLAMAHRFGFGQKTRCGLNGESRGIVEKPYRWSTFTTSTFAIGHGLSVTAMQLAQAFSVVASGGYLSHPYLIKGCINDEGVVVDKHESRPVRILDREVTEILDTFLRGVVQNGTGRPLADAPFAIAGKTGTAEKPNLENGGYYKNKFMAAFAGYFPADSPLVAGVVVLNEPEPIHYGGYTAGPAFKNIAVRFGAIDNYHDLMPGNSLAADTVDWPEAEYSTEQLVKLENLKGDSREKAHYRLQQMGLSAEFSGSGTDVFCTWPAANTQLPIGTQVRCIMTCEGGGKLCVPDFRGLTLRETMNVMKQYGFNFKCRGHGRVYRQSIDPGEIYDGQKELVLYFKQDPGV